MDKSDPLPEVRIATSRIKIALIAIGAWAFAAGGVGMLCVSLFGAAMLGPTAVIGLLGALFFGPIAVWATLKLFDARPALVIDAEGIIDNSSGVAAGRIRWSEVTAIGTSFVVGQRFVCVLVTDTERFLTQGTRLQRFLRRRNMELVGTPITISSNGMAVRFGTLEAALVRGFEEYGRLEA
jgi:hypothetical protein